MTDNGIQLGLRVFPLEELGHRSEEYGERRVVLEEEEKCPQVGHTRYIIYR